MWYDYILGLACIVAIIRLALLLTNNRNYENKVGRVVAWFVGLALFVISWGVIRGVFPSVDLGSKLNSDETYFRPQDKEEQNKKDNSIPIIIK